MSYHYNTYPIYQHTTTIHIQFSTMSHEQSHGAVLPTAATTTSDLAELSGLREQIFSKIFDSVALRPVTKASSYI